RRLRPEIPAEVSALVARLMDADPDQRYPSARTVAAALTGFTLWLPTTFTLEEPNGLKPRKERVLVVDDEPALRRWMAGMLKPQYEVREAGDGETALTEIVEYPPDLVVMDVNLPGLGGAELIERLRSSFPGHDRVKVLLVSGALPAEALGGLAVTGADDFLPKPFNPSEFLSRVRSLLLRRNSRTIGAAATVRIPTTAATRAVPPSGSSPPRPTVAIEVLSFTVSQLLTETGLAAD